jgi:hypothetical protein
MGLLAESQEEARHVAWKPGTDRIFVMALGSPGFLGLPGAPTQRCF